jgi:hypothetical protein
MKAPQQLTFEHRYRKELQLQKAQDYAAEARARNVKPNACAHCANLEKLAEVQRVVANYKPFSAVRSVDHV